MIGENRENALDQVLWRLTEFYHHPYNGRNPAPSTECNVVWYSHGARAGDALNDNWFPPTSVTTSLFIPIGVIYNGIESAGFVSANFSKELDKIISQIGNREFLRLLEGYLTMWDL